MQTPGALLGWRRKSRGGARTELARPPNTESEREGQEGRAEPARSPAPCPARCWTSWRAQVGGRRARSADPRRELRGRHHVAGRRGGRRWLQLGWGPARDAREGPGPRRGFCSFWVLRSPHLPRGWLSSPPQKESDRHLPQTRCGLLDKKRGQQGQGSEARGYLADLLPSLGRSPQSAPSPSNRGDFGFFREIPWRDGVGVRRPKPRVKFRPGEGCLEMGEGQLFFPHRSPPCPHFSWRRASGASGRSFMGRSPPRRRGL